jgi:hypothetical protein
MSYWDTSALVKLYAKEPDSSGFENHALNSPGPLVTSGIALYEARATFRRKETEAFLQAGAAQTLYEQLLQDVAAGKVQIIQPVGDVEGEYGDVLNRTQPARPHPNSPSQNRRPRSSSANALFAPSPKPHHSNPKFATRAGLPVLPVNSRA